MDSSLVTDSPVMDNLAMDSNPVNPVNPVMDSSLVTDSPVMGNPVMDSNPVNPVMDSNRRAINSPIHKQQALPQPG
jgi:hypothetical protein